MYWRFESVVQNLVKFCSQAIISGASQQNNVASVSWMTEVDGDLFEKQTKKGQKIQKGSASVQPKSLEDP